MLPARQIPAMTDPELNRFWSCVDKNEDGCWRWNYHCFNNGYGAFSMRRSRWCAHRIAFTLKHGQQDPNMVIDHLCRNRSCVNPDHMEIVTVGENIRRGETGIELARRTHCPRGHEYTEENTYRRPDTGHRDCRICRRERTNKCHQNQGQA